MIIYALRGPEAFAAATGLSLGVIIVYYYAAAILAGVVVGLLRPFAYNRDAAMGIGVIAAFYGCGRIPFYHRRLVYDLDP